MLERLAPYFERRLQKKISADYVPRNFLSSRIVERNLHRYKLLKLRNTIKYSFENSPFYHNLFEKSDMKPADIKSFEDVKRIPFTNPEDLYNTDNFLAVPKSRITKVFSSSGTTGIPKKIYFTNRDLEKIFSSNALGMKLLYNMGKEDRVRITYDIGYGTNNWGVRYCTEASIQKLGALGITTANRLSPDEELNLLREYKISTIIGTPSYLNYLSSRLDEIYDLKSLGMKRILVGAEPLPEPIRKKMQRIWNTQVFQSYGLIEMGTSVGGECRERNGIHIPESDFFVEVVDPKGNDILDYGEVGELVFTTLSREGMPLIRYRTHDLGAIINEKCPCGLPFNRIIIKGRTDNMITIGSGDNFYPTMLDDVILSLPGVIDYSIVLNRKHDKDYIKITVESKSMTDKFKKDVEVAVMRIPEIYDGVFNSKTIKKPEVILVKPYSIPRTSVKINRFVDRRHLYDQ